ncbi:thiazolylpeptide-type bacteriocin [Dactylosporangium sucinum]|uniref:Thiazolylpeptide-type bacteriocin n=1 Tax=Dactylosporangium sucinum TaxID=1424081 RepID=A0A917TT65_9ACTN|nr:thiazolylpeptide-type bacteriocin [Dactylosporangium sucinum]GGM35012.1 hypothetical protein GCM10007977_040650 [Dactylosporangium sucinum]
MNEELSLAALTNELRALEIETFELHDYTDEHEMPAVGASSTCSSTTSTTSTCA